MLYKVVTFLFSFFLLLSCEERKDILELARLIWRMDRFKYIALESSGSGISPNFENDRNAKANRREDRRKGNARMMEKKKICIRASSCWPRGSGLVGFDLWTGTKDRRTYVHIRTHTRVHIIRVQGIHIYARHRAEFEVIRKRRTIPDAVNVVARGIVAEVRA